MGKKGKHRIVRFIFKLLLVLVLLLVLAVAFLWYNANTTIRLAGEKIVTKITGCETTIGNVDVSILKGHINMSDVVIKNPKQDVSGKKTPFFEEKLFELSRLEIKMDMYSLLSDAVHVEQVMVDSPKICYEKTPFYDSNIQVLMAFVEKSMGPKTPEEEAEETKVIVDKLVIQNATVSLSSCGLTMPIPLPMVEVTNLGTEEQGITISTALGRTIQALFDKIKDITSSTLDSIGSGTKKVLDVTTDGLKSAGDTLKAGGKAVSDGVTSGGKAVVDGVKSLFD